MESGVRMRGGEKHGLCDRKFHLARTQTRAASRERGVLNRRTRASADIGNEEKGQREVVAGTVGEQPERKRVSGRSGGGKRDKGILERGVLNEENRW